MTAQRSIERPRYVHALDGLRGVLAIGVMTYHLGLYSAAFDLDGVGSYGVYMFFVLSGFAIAWVYDKDSGVDLIRYTGARIARIWPLYAATTLATMLSAWPMRYGVLRILSNVFLFFPFSGTGDIPAGGWSIGIEVLAYLAVPMILAVIAGWRQLAMVAIAALGLRVLYVHTIWPQGTPLDSMAYFQLPSFLVFFLAGAATARWRRSHRIEVRPSLLFSMVAAGVVTFIVASTLSQRQLYTGLGGALLCAAAVATVFAAASIVVRHAGVQRLCRFLGEVSYATYLLHPLVFTALNRIAPSAGVAAFATFPTAICAAWLCHRVFEMPAASLIRWFFERQRPRVDALP